MLDKTSKLFEELEKAYLGITVKDKIMAELLLQAKASDRVMHSREKLDSSKYAVAIYESIVSQQLSVKASDTIWKRVVAMVGDPQDTKSILAHSLEEYRSVGLSRQKATYMLSIAESLLSGAVKLDHLDELSDEEVIEELVKLKGVGRWTAEMFLIFSLARPDVFSLGDLGLVTAVSRLYGVDRKDKEAIEKISKKWAPHRSICSLALWHSQDNK